jgi:hypothetical protein
VFNRGNDQWIDVAARLIDDGCNTAPVDAVYRYAGMEMLNE